MGHERNCRKMRQALGYKPEPIKNRKYQWFKNGQKMNVGLRLQYRRLKRIIRERARHEAK